MDCVVRNRIAIILARGGSKRLPRKNIIDFGGKPLLAWSVLAALESEQFDEVLVSTDDEEIAQVALQYGAEVPFLRLEAADDISSSSEATCVALLQAEEYWETKFDVVAQLMANCPLRTAEDVCDSISAFENNTAPSQISCFRFGWMNPWWAVRLQNDGKPQYLFPKVVKKRSQDLPDLYCPTGALWMANRDALIGSRDFYMEGHRFEPMHWLSAVDIDDEDDLCMANACLELRAKQNK